MQQATMFEEVFELNSSEPNLFVYAEDTSQQELTIEGGALVVPKGAQTRLARAERNRASAARSRIRKKQRHNEFQERGRRAEELNRRLKDEIAGLARHLQSLRARLQATLSPESQFC